MTDTEIIIEVAKLDGFEVRPNYLHTGYWFYKDGGSLPTGCANLYLTSRDAIIPVIERRIITEESKLRFLGYLGDVIPPRSENNNTIFPYIIATPRQLCIALLKATGKWKE